MFNYHLVIAIRDVNGRPIERAVKDYFSPVKFSDGDDVVIGEKPFVVETVEWDLFKPGCANLFIRSLGRLVRGEDDAAAEFDEFLHATPGSAYSTLKGPK